jgi:uncharacterized protein
MIFVDTSAWLALADSHDKDHARATAFLSRINRGEFGKQVTTNYVMTETLTIIRRRLGLGPALALAETVRAGRELGVYWVEPIHHNEAIGLMAQHADKEWSVTDCTSFVIMRSLGIREAFTFDRDFVRAGFSRQP